ncbi:hypothetical protein BJV78DRAFT_427235 [Lactifluus subvellereus]|nr:hypothetical protein BJV78DRAFT_427235 [Lactifluus subvellereus]
MVLIRFARWVVALYTSWRNRAHNKKSHAQGPQQSLCRAGRISPRVTIGAHPDNVLLDIFEFYREAEYDLLPVGWPWNKLVHVCQRWRYVVFASPLRLDLCLICTSKTPVREALDVWPPLPITIDLSGPCDHVDDVIATLKHRDRVRAIGMLGLTNSQLERLAPMMQEPFPVLTWLRLWTTVVRLPRRFPICS